MSGILLAIVVFLLIGGLASAWLLGVRLRREQQATGILALAGMHWREFQRLVLEVMARRGYRQAGSTDMSDDHGLIELEHGGRMSLLSTKHGTAYVLGPAAITEFASDLQLRGAGSGWMTTLGSVTPDTRSLARVQKIELLDGHTLWAEIEPQLDPAQLAEIMGAVRARANRHVLLSWILAAVAGIAMFLLPGRDAPAPAPSQQAATPAATPAAPPRPPPSAATPQPQMTAPVPEDPAALAGRRRKVADAVATLPWVDRAVWSTRSTLVVHLAGAPDRAGLCALLEPYAELRASRLQLQPPRDSDTPVRFIQCHAY
jgi:restriction system protein